MKDEEPSFVDNVILGIVVICVGIYYGVIWLYEWVVLHLHMLWDWFVLFF